MKSVNVLLNKENFQIQWDNLEEFKTLTFQKSPENDAFAKGVALYQEAKRSGLLYLLPLYAHDAVKGAFVTQEIELHKLVMAVFFRVYRLIFMWFITSKYENLLLICLRLPADILNGWRNMKPIFEATDFADKRLLHFGFFVELLKTYVVLIESFSDQVFANTNRSSDALVASLKKTPQLQQEVTAYLFNFFEKRSLYKADEYIALAMLSDDFCQLEGKNQA
jgi:hypothetical protein